MNIRALLNRLERRDDEAVENFTYRRIVYGNKGRKFKKGKSTSLWGQIKSMRSACNSARESRQQLSNFAESDEE